jgi:Tfp pilus assembly protein PilV
MAPLSKQKGDALIEALISIVLLSTIMIGLTFLVAKTAVAQKNTSVLNMTLFALRSQVQTQGLSTLCAGTGLSTITVADNAVPISATCPRAAFTATVAGQIIAIPAGTTITDSTLKTQATPDNAALIGGDGVISLN